MRRIHAPCALWALLFLAALYFSECLETVVRPDAGWSVTPMSSSDQCSVCTVDAENDTQISCHKFLTLAPEKEVKLLFNCSEQTYTVMLVRSVECTKDLCSPATIDAQTSILTEFSRTFTWNFTAPQKTVVSLDVLGEGLVETLEPCTDGFQYVVMTHYCRGGSVTRLDVPNQVLVSLMAAPNAQVDEVLFQASAGPPKGRSVVATVDSSTMVVVSRVAPEPECEICTNDGSTVDCNSDGKTLTNVESLSVEFSCTKPEDVFSVEMKKDIACTQSSCTPAAAEVDPALLKDFKRSLMFDISVPEKTELTLDFPGDGLREISPVENCPDGYQYSLSITKPDGTIKAYGYCKGGSVTSVDLLRATTVTVQVPKGGEVDQTVFNVKAAPRAGRTMSVTLEPDNVIYVRRMSEEPECGVCVGQAPDQKCDPKYLQLKGPGDFSVEFSCPQPQDLFTVEIVREIDCAESPCSSDVVLPDKSLFTDFNRSIYWDVVTAFTHTFQLDFPEPGMRQIPNEETCPDEHTYSIVMYWRTGPVNFGTFCKGGTVTSILVRYKGRVSLQVPGYGTLNPVDFKLKKGPETDNLGIVKVNLPRGVSDTDFMTPNYPRDFPDDQTVQWDFTVPGMHNYTVQFVDHTEPECLSNDVVVEYRKEDKKVTRLTLTDAQPQHQQGNFNLLLTNCQTNKTLQGLTLNYRVSLMRSGHPVLCTVDLSKHPGVSLQLQKVGLDPNCEMSLNSEVKEKVNVAAGTTAKLSFLDCPAEDTRLTASEVIECQNMASCPSRVLTVPTLDSCLQMPLHSFTWHVNIPPSGTVDLVSPTGTLKQSLPGQMCNQPFTLHVAESDGFSVGDFCFNGTIEKLQVHANVSVTATARDFSKTKGPFLNVSVSQEISETIIYRVNPSLKAPTLLATPNWPRGMKPFSTISWIVALPSQYKAQLKFTNVSQPKCEDRHTAINVKMLGHEEETMSRREDERAEDLEVANSFYLNMSNCVPEEGHFGALTQVTLEKKINLLAIVLGIAGAVLVALAVLGAVCFITWKKKRDKMNKESSIYIGKGSIFRPGDQHFPKTRSNNESHVYDSIDETMVYGHLLGDSTYSDSIQDNYKGKLPDTYHTFTGTTDGTLPVIKEPDLEPEVDGFGTFLSPSDSFMPPRPRTPISRQDSLGFQDSRMVDNELYTFKSTGDMNTIRLSAADLDPEPPVMEDSL